MVDILASRRLVQERVTPGAFRGTASRWAAISCAAIMSGVVGACGGESSPGATDDSVVAMPTTSMPAGNTPSAPQPGVSAVPDNPTPINPPTGTDPAGTPSVLPPSSPTDGSSTIPSPAPSPTLTDPVNPLPSGNGPQPEPSATTPGVEPTQAPTAPAEPTVPGPETTAPGPSATVPEPSATSPTEPPAMWHGAVATAVTEAVLNEEYQRWKTALVQDCPEQSSAVVVKDGGQVVSEGIAYGMLLSANMNDQTLFDKLWKFYNDHLDENGLMNWSMGVCDAPGNNMAHAAADAELDALMALLQASQAFGGTYKAEAEALAEKVIAHEVEECDGRWILKPGDVWGGCSDMTGQQRINPSYFAPGYYRAFAHHFPSQATTWNALLEGSYELYAVTQTRLSGLFPDWSAVDGADWYGASYGYDACRTPWRLAVDYAFSGEPRAASALSDMNAWIAQNGGIPVASMANNSAFQGGFALASIIDAASFDQQVSAWLGAGGDDAPYFQGTLRVLYLLVAGGKFPSTL